ncbi:hypothetical protein NPIL_569961 [Nephila pilipes]|uniref:Uncharacterized protein n=1 Tax=Nephila pilipes TaxID=299642 RepID=A0A8X6UBT9_NEPPI|nr:hypothetical protein NPIL_569961 [Nephila pilipes]
MRVKHAEVKRQIRLSSDRPVDMVVSDARCDTLSDGISGLSSDEINLQTWDGQPLFGILAKTISPGAALMQSEGRPGPVLLLIGLMEGVEDLSASSRS